MTEVPGTDGRRRWPPPDWATPTAAVTGAGLVGVILYAVARVATARFYASFDVRPEDLKLSYPGLLEEAVGALAFTLGTAAALALLALFVSSLEPIRALRRLARLIPEQGEGAVYVLLLVVSLFATWGICALAGAGDVTTALVTAAVGVGVTSAWSERIGPTAAAALYIFAVTLIFGIKLWSAAGADAQRVHLGHALDSGRGVQLVPWRAEVAVVIPKSPTPRALAGVELRCVLRLGVSDQGTVVYSAVTRPPRAGERRTLIIRPEDATVQFVPDARGCARGDGGPADWPDDTSGDSS